MKSFMVFVCAFLSSLSAMAGGGGGGGVLVSAMNISAPMAVMSQGEYSGAKVLALASFSSGRWIVRQISALPEEIELDAPLAHAVKRSEVTGDWIRIRLVE